MSNETQMSKPEEAKAANAEPEYLLTKSGIMIIGAKLIGEKLLGLVLEILANHTDSKISVVEFRNDNYPQDADGPVFGVAFADTHSFAVNLEHCWHKACVTASKGDQHLGFLGILWINVLSVIGHELDHLDIATADRDSYEEMRVDEELVKALEESADETAKQEIIRLARIVDVEIPGADGLGWFGTKLMALFTTDTTKELDWVKKLQSDIEKGLVYDGGENKQCFSFREFIKKVHDPDGKSGNWDQTPTPVNIEAELETGETITIKADPVPEAKVEVKPVADVVEEAVAQTDATVAAVFVAATEDNSPAIVMADGVNSEGQPTIVMEEVQPEAVEAPAGVLEATTAMMPNAAVDEVPLPEAVVAAQAANIPPTQPEAAATYEESPCTMDMALAPQFMEALWKRLYHHLFTKCGWQQDPSTGQFYFSNPAGVLEFVSIQDLVDHYGAQNFVMECDGQSEMGAGIEGINCTGGMVKGFCTSKQGLPAYNIYLNIGGQRIKRSFLPQNVQKRNAQNAYSNPAIEAQQGHCIAWVYRGEAADGAPFKEKCAAKLRDNVYEVIS